jgi:hypothetical protein
MGRCTDSTFAVEMVSRVWAAVLPWASGVGCGKGLFMAGWLLRGC